MTDERICALLKSEPERGLERLVSKYSGLVCSVLSGKLRSARFTRQDVEDAASETFFEFWRGFEKSPCAPYEIKARLCVIAKRNAIDRLRKLYRQPDTLSTDEESSEEIRSDFSLEGEFELKEERIALINSVNALGKPDSELIIRKYYLGQSSKEIAKATGMSVSNVDTRTHRAILKLREKFGGKEHE